MTMDIPVLRDIIKSINRCDKFIDRLNERWVITTPSIKSDNTNNVLGLYQSIKKIKKPAKIVAPPPPPPAIETIMRDRSLWRLIVRVLYPEYDLLTVMDKPRFMKEFNQFIADNCNKNNYFREFPASFRQKELEDALISKQPTDDMIEVLVNLFNVDIVCINQGIERIYRPALNRFILVTKHEADWETTGDIVSEYKFRPSATPKLLADYQQIAMKLGKPIWKAGKGIKMVLRTKEELASDIEN